MKGVSFLDVPLNLETGKYQPDSKADNNPLYINILSNYPPSIIKNFRGNISKELILYQQMKELLISLTIYNNALAESGFKHKITFQKQLNTPTVTNNTENRKKNTILFNPPN